MEFRWSSKPLIQLSLCIVHETLVQKIPKSNGFAENARSYGARGSLVVKALGYKPEGHEFETQWGEILNLPDPSGCTMSWGLLAH
jgi:hypothetical protein